MRGKIIEVSKDIEIRKNSHLTRPSRLEGRVKEAAKEKGKKGKRIPVICGISIYTCKNARNCAWSCKQ
jgi:hypothetical protein